MQRSTRVGRKSRPCAPGQVPAQTASEPVRAAGRRASVRPCPGSSPRPLPAQEEPRPRSLTSPRPSSPRATLTGRPPCLSWCERCSVNEGGGGLEIASERVCTRVPDRGEASQPHHRVSLSSPSSIAPRVPVVLGAAFPPRRPKPALVVAVAESGRRRDRHGVALGPTFAPTWRRERRVPSVRDGRWREERVGLTARRSLRRGKWVEERGRGRAIKRYAVASDRLGLRWDECPRGQVGERERWWRW